jgi:hypothetical protein
VFSFVDFGGREASVHDLENVYTTHCIGNGRLI